MVYNCTVLLLPVTAAVLEALPFGAVLIFAPNPEDRIRNTYSFFNFLPFGYGNFAPFITAILTCILTLAAVLMLIRKSERLGRFAFAVSAAAAVISLLPPVVLGFDYCSPVGIAVTVCLTAETVLLKVKKPYSGAEE